MLVQLALVMPMSITASADMSNTEFSLKQHLSINKYTKAAAKQRLIFAGQPASSDIKEGELAALLRQATEYHSKGNYAEAALIWEKILTISEKVIGPDHPGTASSLNNLAFLYDKQGLYGKAEPLYMRALAIYENALGHDHQHTGTGLNNLASLYNKQGLYGKAEPLYIRALEIKEKALGSDHPDTAISLNNLASLYNSQGLYSKAEPLYIRALAITEKALGSNHPDTAISLNNLALLYNDQGLYSKAEPLYIRALAITEKALGSNHPDTATSLNNLALLYKDQGHYGKAEPLYIRALAIKEKALGSHHPDTAISLSNLALLYIDQGLYGKAEPILLRALRITEKTLGPDHQNTGTSLNNLALLYKDQGHYGKAEPLYIRALAIKEKALGSDHPDTASILNNLALLYKDQGLYGKAELILLRALRITEKTLGPDHPDTATSLNNLAVLYNDQGLYSKSEQLYTRALGILEKALGSDHQDTAIGLNNLASVYIEQGRYAKAEALLTKALTIQEKTLGPNHPDTATSTDSLAVLYKEQGLYTKADPLYRKALAIREKNLGPNHPDTAKSLGNLAVLKFNQRQYTEAEPLLIRAHSITEKALGPNHSDNAKALNNLAHLYHTQGLYGKAVTLYKRALSIKEKALGPIHPDIATSLNNLALIYKDQGFYGKAVSVLIRALGITEKELWPDYPRIALFHSNLSLLYGGIKKPDKQLAMLGYGISTENHWLMREAPLQSHKNRSILANKIGNAWLLSFDLASHYPAAAELALSTRLNRQGIIQEIEQRQALLLRSTETQEKLASRLSALNTQLANLGINRNQRISTREQRDRLEAELYRSMPDLQLKEVSPAQVSAVLSADSVLVEFQRYQPYDYKVKKPKDQPWGAPQYLALILKPNGSIKAVPLGPAKPIEAAIAKALATTQEALADSQTKWDSVRHLVLDPLKSQLKDSNHWFLSPDAELTRIPFLALPAANSGERLLSDDVTLSVLTTGRDLLRLQKPPGTSEKAAVIVNPSYALGGASSSVAKSDFSDQVAQRRSAELGAKTWAPLPKTQSEGEEIAQLLSVPLISKDQATTNLLQTIHGPKVLHVATHGFFQLNQETTPPDLLRTISSDHQLLSGLKTEDPMLRSGLVLAGADNPTANPADDGYLTAAEAAGLQLDGTELVVLSACSTGQGDSKTGEGVYGLQRALTVAGASSTLLSLWKVDDDATRAFMVRYYTLLKEGKGRGEALVQVQREFRTDPAYKAKNWDHPYYWAAWQLTGDWKPIKGL